MTRRTDVLIVLGLAILVAGFLTGQLFNDHGASDRSAAQEHSAQENSADDASAQGASSQVTLWTCSMHPQIKLPHPGKCPICGMDLIPLKTEPSESGASHQANAESNPATLTLSKDAAALAEIETAPVVRGNAEKNVRLVGKIDFDETKLKTISAWVPGRLDRLYVDYTGIRVRKGDHLVSIYSPELISTQEELIQALNAQHQLQGSSIGLLKSTAKQTVSAAREKLHLFGLTEKQIAEIEQRGHAEDHVTIYAPSDGVVVKKSAMQGDYVKTGQIVYEIADLSQLWVKLDAYESDLVWIRYGQDVEFTAEAYPGRKFEGRISFISPVLDPKTRTAKVRVNVKNEDALLKPGVFVHALVRSTIAAQGRVMDAQLAGKWICPMHPDVVKDKPGTCDICGMTLVTAKSLGYAVAAKDEEPPLLIPASAPLITGKRAVVYVRIPGDEPRFEGREVVLGPRAGDQYIVNQGLREGELVVVNGAFKIDSAMQIQAKPSMMSPSGEGAAPMSMPMPKDGGQ
jgi:Cu(I)/Ag(I) efflux system membrane fusion protein